MTNELGEEGIQGLIESARNPPPLHSDLEPWMEDSPPLGKVLKHPLVFSVPYHAMFNGMLNLQYEKKKERLEKFLTEGDWSSYLFLHERPYRLQAFLEIYPSLGRNEYWDLLGSIWVDSENIGQNLEVWRELMTMPVPGRVAMMTKEERKELRHLPDVVRVYRGHQRQNHRGLSWTLSTHVALWFSSRFSSSAPRVVTGLVRKRDILALITRRSESEVIVLPEKVHFQRKFTDRPARRESGLEILFQRAWDQAPLHRGHRTVHGIDHWNRVDRNVVRLCRQVPGADVTVGRLFAALHDSRRENENNDPDHGRRASKYARQLRSQGYLDITDAQMVILEIACDGHNDGQVSDDPTIGVCWDADRMDLPRVGIIPDPALLSTDAARRLIGR